MSTSYLQKMRLLFQSIQQIVCLGLRKMRLLSLSSADDRLSRLIWAVPRLSYFKFNVSWLCRPMAFAGCHNFPNSLHHCCFGIVSHYLCIPTICLIAVGSLWHHFRRPAQQPFRCDVIWLMFLCRMSACLWHHSLYPFVRIRVLFRWDVNHLVSICSSFSSSVFRSLRLIRHDLICSRIVVIVLSVRSPCTRGLSASAIISARFLSQ